MFYRLIKSNWAISNLTNKEPNPNFKREIQGPRIVEGCFSVEEVQRLNELGYNAYWFPNHPSRNVYQDMEIKYLSGKLIDVFEYVFLDMDLKDKVYDNIDHFLQVLQKFSVKPTLTIKSGHGVHVYWRIKDLERDAYVYTQLALLRHFKTDESVWTVLQLMRVPGSVNTKELDNFRKVEVVEAFSTGNHYELKQFPTEIFSLSKEDLTRARNHLDKLDGRIQMNILEDVNLDELPDSFLQLIAKDRGLYNLFYDPIGARGDRSSADMSLANILFQKKIPKKEALQVLANTQKALSKGNHRINYAQATLDKAYVERTINKFLTVGQTLRAGHSSIERVLINGPLIFDCLVTRWAKKQILGLIGGAGIGKTAVSLFIIKSIIENNPNNDDVFVFISLEMPAAEIIDRWLQLVGKDSPLTERLYVIDTEEEKKDLQRVIGLQEVYEYCADIKVSTGKEIGAVIIDHIGILSRHIDTRKDYTFGIESEQAAGWGNIRTLSIASLATQMKTLAKMLDAFLIPLTQTTKAKGVGYTPLGKDAAFGVSQYENIVDYLITLWQPLLLVQDQLETRFLAWQYAKIRHQHKDDVIKPNSYKLLVYDMVTGLLESPDETQYKQFAELLPLAHEQAALKEKKIESNYSRSLSAEGLKELEKKLKAFNKRG